MFPQIKEVQGLQKAIFLPMHVPESEKISYPGVHRWEEEEVDFVD